MPNTRPAPALAAHDAPAFVEVHRFAKSPTETLVFELGAYGGRPVVNIRVRFPTEDGGSSYSRKGLTLATAHLGELRAGVDKLIAAAAAGGDA